jgi:outer membrane receptor protein involved in Fe transport
MTEGASLDLERVEVLKGPQGTLFGQNSTGGAVNYIAAKPTRHLSAGVDATYGRYNQTDISGFVSGPLSDTLRVRVAARHEGRDGYQENYVSTGTDRNPKNGSHDFSTARLLLDWAPNEGFNLELNVNGWKDRSDSQAKQKIAYAPVVSGGFPGSATYPDLQSQLAAYPNAPDRATAAGFGPNTSYRRNDGFYQVSLRANSQLSDSISLASISSVSHLNVSTPTDNDGTIYPNPDILLVGSITAYSQELRLAGNASGLAGLTWVIGGNYEYDVSHDRQNLEVHGSDTGIPTGTRFDTFSIINNQKVHTAAVFGNVEYELTDGLKFQGALRYTDRRDRFAGCIADSGLSGGLGAAFAELSSILSGSPTVIAPGACATLGADNKPLPIVKLHLNEDNLSYRVGLSWKSDTGTLLYANLTKGYKAGAFSTLPALRPQQFDPVGQESVLAYEVGFKTALAQRKLVLDGAVFYYDYGNKQLTGYLDTGFPFGTLPALVSVPKSRVIGAELAALFRPTRGLTLNMGATYVNSKVQSSFVTATPFGGTANIKGEAFPNTPRWQVSADGEYQMPVSTRVDAFIGGSFTYRSATVASFAGGPLFDVSGYGLIDARAGIEEPSGRWRLELWARNLTNKFYWTSVQHIEDTVTRLAGMPATYGVTLRWRT